MMGNYDLIGGGYAFTRRPDPRVAHQILAALGDARTIVNVGAGTGSYEPAGAIAVEPSIEMIRQRPVRSAPVVRAIAERLPFADRSFDAALAILTIHHWSDRARGLAELRRVAPERVVILTYDPDCSDWFWLVKDYLPEIAELDRKRLAPIGDLGRDLGAIRVVPVVVPADCVDGFLCAFWRRPEAYLDPNVRRAISSFALLPAHTVQRGVDRLAADLRSGRWDERFGHLRRLESVDLGYRLVIAEHRGQE
jgi:SAM-dependent methyltransferase